MAKGIRIDPKAYSATWKERDEALLIDLLERKIHELRWEIADAASPYERARLKGKRADYKKLLTKVHQGQYNGDILMAELSAAVTYQRDKKKKKDTVLSKYVSSYDDVDFDFESYFGRTRYYGVALPIIILVLMIAFIGIITMSAFLPVEFISTAESYMSLDDMWLSLTNVGYMKLDETNNDYYVINDGNWPKGKWKDVTVKEEYVLAKNASGDTITDRNGNPTYIKRTFNENEQYTKSAKDNVEGAFEVRTYAYARNTADAVMHDSAGNMLYSRTSVIPERIYLCKDLGMIAIDMTAFDVMRALFRTKPFSAYEIDFGENFDELSGISWYYKRYMLDRADDIKLESDLEGNYDPVAAIKFGATFGSIYFMWLAIICAAISIIICIFRLFSYTSRKLHVFSLLTFIFSLFAFVLPAFLDIKGASFKAALDALKAYFSTSAKGFMDGTDLLMGNLLFVALALLPFISMLLPAIFRNRARNNAFVVPKGNKPPRQELVSRPIPQGKPVPYTSVQPPIKRAR